MQGEQRGCVDILSHFVMEHGGVVGLRGLAHSHGEGRLHEGQLRILQRGEDDHLASSGGSVAERLQQHGGRWCHLPVVRLAGSPQRADQRPVAPQGPWGYGQVQVVDDGGAVLLQGPHGRCVDHLARLVILCAVCLHRSGHAEQGRAQAAGQRPEHRGDAMPALLVRRGAELDQWSGMQLGHGQQFIHRLLLRRRHLQTRHRCHRVECLDLLPDT
mmetsp:Transcript_56297/g.144921  ORF Transcript_56297/g.144921 Transcript_56297/m.144921 type:complete len:215 (-) Transcript_56297:74-718(-)